MLAVFNNYIGAEPLDHKGEGFIPARKETQSVTPTNKHSFRFSNK